MNILTIWNDCLPLNIAEVIDYAHQRGVKIILGFDWGWGRTDLDVFKPEHQAVIKQEVLHKFKHDYCGIGADGLYFQTLTEHNETHANGESLTKCICRMVNDIASDLFEIEPDLNLQFGLHATSVQENYPDLSELDPRITIMWEDAGVIPYSYMPITDISDNDAAVSPINKEINTPERTLEYSKKLAMFRKDSAFGMVPKGWMVLDWLHEFEHHRPFLLGERDNCFIEDRLRDRQPHWNRVNKLWIKNYGLAAQFYRELLNSQSRLIVTGLIEDGMLERKIQFSVALFSEMMWNPQRTDEALLESAMKPYYGTTT